LSISSGDSSPLVRHINELLKRGDHEPHLTELLFILYNDRLQHPSADRGVCWPATVFIKSPSQRINADLQRYKHTDYADKFSVIRLRVRRGML